MKKGNHQTKSVPEGYPRMTLQRSSYTCLNGIWEYQITEKGKKPLKNHGWKEIVVPFALGCPLSKSDDFLDEQHVLWYRKKFDYHPSPFQTLLNFEAVDQSCSIYLNRSKVAEHHGGYAPFSVDITAKVDYENELLVEVFDPTDKGDYAYGKQRIDHQGMWYTPTSGIWQTVWVEDLPESALTDVKISPDFDHSCVYLQMAGRFSQAVITVFKDGKLVHRGITIHKEYTIPMKHVQPWTLDNPNLYDLYIQTEDETIKSYFGMRKFERKVDEYGHVRFFLNHQPLFLTGVLDQGYTMDGGYTYESDELIKQDIQNAKDLGFNFIRKHVKQENRNFYYYCDVMGMLVMQDMVSGGKYSFGRQTLLPTIGMKLSGTYRTELQKQTYYQELDALLDTLFNYVSIFCWVSFNEGWGQFDTPAVTQYIKNYDNTRLVDSASGWFDEKCGDFQSIHSYFSSRFMPRKKDDRILLLSEFGGFSYLEPKHSRVQKPYGYRKYTNRVAYNEDVLNLYETWILKNINHGLSGCVYTQLYDVEDECNGLYTADRKMCKVDRQRMKQLNQKIIRSMKK